MLRTRQAEKNYNEKTRAAGDHYIEMRRAANKVISRKKRNNDRAALSDVENFFIDLK